MKKILGTLALAAMFIVVVVPLAQAGQAGRDNTRNILVGVIAGCQFVDCRRVASGIFGGDRYDRYDGYYSAGERSAYYRGRAEAEAQIQVEREREAYESGCGGYCGGDSYGYYRGGSSCYGDCDGGYGYRYRYRYRYRYGYGR